MHTLLGAGLANTASLLVVYVIDQMRHWCSDLIECLPLLCISSFCAKSLRSASTHIHKPVWRQDMTLHIQCRELSRPCCLGRTIPPMTPPQTFLLFLCCMFFCAAAESVTSWSGGSGEDTGADSTLLSGPAPRQHSCVTVVTVVMLQRDTWPRREIIGCRLSSDTCKHRPNALNRTHH